MNLSDWWALTPPERARAWQNMSPEQRQELWISLAAFTPAYDLPYPDNYAAPADSPLAFRELALATDAALNLMIEESVANARFLDKTEGDTYYSAKSHNHSGVYAPASHSHSSSQVGIKMGRFGAGSLGGGQTLRKVVAHGLGKTPTIAIGTCYRDDGSTLSGVVSVESFDATNVVWLVRNLNNSTSETLDVSWLVM